MLPTSSSSRGFTLVELAVIIALVGLSAVAAASLALPIIEASKRIQTEEKIKLISRALAEYAKISASVPCPAEPNITATSPPFGYSVGTGAAGADMPTGGCQTPSGAALLRGIVPFRTLNLSEDMVRDGWGNYFVYAVSPNFTRHYLNDLQNQATHAQVGYHALCRTREFYKKVGPTLVPITSDLAHVTTPKVYFCCGYGRSTPAGVYDFPPTTDLVINNAFPLTAATRTSPVRTTPDPGTPAIQRIVINARDSTTNPILQPFANLDPNASFVPAGISPITVVYALASLGRNGRGAFDVTNGSQRDLPPGGSAEAVNTNLTGLNFVDLPINDDPANTFDDIVFWETQDMIMAQVGESCATP